MTVDAGFASHAEHALSERIRDTAHLEMTPYVSVAGKAYLSSLFTGQWSSVNSRIRDVEVPGFGLVSLEYGAVNVKVPRESVLSGDFGESQTKQYFTKLGLDGLSLGRKMGLTDLVIQNLEDSSPSGGWETEALFEATPRGWSAPARVAVKLRIVRGDVVISLQDIIAAPKGPDAQKLSDPSELSDQDRRTVQDTFSITLPGDEIPLGLPATRIYVSGGTITIEGEQIMCTVSPVNFMPPTSKDAAELSAQSAEKLPDTNCRVRR